MNAAFLLVTTAWFAGDVPAAPGAGAPAASAPAPNACGGGCCDSCCDSGGHRLRDRLRGLFNRGGCCESSSCCNSGCNSGCGNRFGGWHNNHSCGSSCGSSCNSCDSCCGGGGQLLGRLRGLFNRHNNGCCDNGCNGCGGGVTPRAGEVIPTPPKKMPNPNGKEPPTKEIRIDNQPNLTPGTPSIAPPVIIPGNDPAIDNRNPF